MSQTKTTTALANLVGPSAVDDVRAARLQLDEDARHDIHTLAEHARRAGERFRQRLAADHASSREPSNTAKDVSH